MYFIKSRKVGPSTHNWTCYKWMLTVTCYVFIGWWLSRVMFWLVGCHNMTRDRQHYFVTVHIQLWAEGQHCVIWLNTRTKFVNNFIGGTKSEIENKMRDQIYNFTNFLRLSCFVLVSMSMQHSCLLAVLKMSFHLYCW